MPSPSITTAPRQGANEYVSALIMDDTGAYTHYGRLAQVGASAGMATFTLPELAEGSKVYIFNEQYNGDDKPTMPAIWWSW